MNRKQFTVISYGINKDGISGADRLVAELSEVRNLTVDGNLHISSHGSEGDFFAFPANHFYSRQISANPYEVIELDLGEFVAEQARLKNSNRSHAFIHRDLIRLRHPEIFDRFDTLRVQIEPSLHIRFNELPKIIASHALSFEISMIRDHKGSYFKLLERTREDIKSQKDGSFYMILANCYQDVGDSEKATEFYLEAAKHDEVAGDAWLSLACLRILAGKDYERELEKALMFYNREMDHKMEIVDSLLNISTSITCRKSYTLIGIKEDLRLQFTFLGGLFAPVEIDDVADQVSNVFRTLKYHYKTLKPEQNGYFFAEVSFIEEYPYVFLREFLVAGIGYEELLTGLNRYFGSK